jgi:hypothetical protein
MCSTTTALATFIFAWMMPFAVEATDNGGLNSFLRAAVRNGTDSAPVQACFWNQLPHMRFERGETTSFNQAYETLDIAKLVCVQQENCKAVTEENGKFIISDQRSAEADVSAVSWVYECEEQVPATLSLVPRAGSSEESNNNFFHIKVLTMDRLKSLKRLMDSLKAAYYDGDTVNIDFFVDYPPAKDSKKLMAKLNARKLIIDHLENWEWPYGTKRIHVRVKNGGLIGQWLESWWPNNDRDAALVLEDDLSVSKFYYRWCKRAISKYLWDSSNFDPQVFGISLQRQYLVPMTSSHNKVNVPGNCPYKYQLIGSWGQIFFPQAWRSFRQWFDGLPSNFHPLVDGMITSQWYSKTWQTTKPWTMHIIRWAAEKQMMNIYTNFDGKNSLCTNYREPGLHFHGKAQGADSKIITSWDAKQDECYLDSKSMPMYDFGFNKVNSYKDLEGRYSFKKKLSDYKL